VLLVGGTGTGKSTLSKFLRQDPSLTIMQNEAEDFVFDDGEQKIGNQDNHRSKTLIPQVDKDTQSGVQLVDCAGFEDTRHPMYDLLASFFTQKIFNAARHMKIILVESFERMRLSSDRTAFMGSIKQLAELLQDEVTAFNGSIGLVATKADSTKSDEQLQRSVKIFLTATVNSLQIKQREAEERAELTEVTQLKRQIQLVQFLSSDDKVTIFRRPSAQQSPWILPSLKKNFDHIREMIFQKLTYLNTENHQFRVSVAADTVAYIQNSMFQATEAKLQNILGEIGNALTLAFTTNAEKVNSQYLKEDIAITYDYVSKYAANMENVKSPTQLIDFFKQNSINPTVVMSVDLEMRKFEFLCSVVGSDIVNFHNQVAGMYGTWAQILTLVHSNMKFYLVAKTLTEQSGRYEIYSKPAFPSAVTHANYFSYVTYLLSLNFNSNTFLAASSISPTAKHLHLLNRIKSEHMNPKVTTVTHGNYVSYSGHYVLSSQIQSPEAVRGQIVIMAAQKFFVDQDLNLIDTHLSIMAPEVEVVGANRQITSRGSSGAALPSLQAPTPGANGLNGNSGYSSGVVTINTLDVLNAPSLKILTAGGDGSAGQSGGDGVNGQNSAPPILQSLHGTDGDITAYINSQNYAIAYWSVTHQSSGQDIFVLYNKKRHYEDKDLMVTNKNGARAPTGGGNGGDGGAGAPPGAVNLVLKNAATSLETTSSTGLSGAGGLGGKAGVNAATCAFSLFGCHGKRKDKYVLFFKTKRGSFKYDCALKQQAQCDSMFSAAADGKNGLIPAQLAMQTYKSPLATSTEDQARDFCKLAAAPLTLEKSGRLHSFLGFVSSLPGASGAFTGTNCV
jgi:hypothetical protein